MCTANTSVWIHSTFGHILLISFQKQEMATVQLVLRGVPAELHRELNAAATRNHRSLNGEILVRLTASLHASAAGTDELFSEVERIRSVIDPIALAPEEIRVLKNEGRW